MTKLRTTRIETLLNAAPPTELSTSKAGALRGLASVTAARPSRSGHGFTVHQRAEVRRPQTFVNRRRGK